MSKGNDFSVDAAVGGVAVKVPGIQGGKTGASSLAEPQEGVIPSVASDVASFGLPTISVTAIELSNSIDMARPKQDPHIDHPDEVSAPTLSEIQEANEASAMRVSIRMYFKEVIGSDGLFSFLSKSEFINYVKVCVVQCMGEEMHKQISKNPTTYLNPVDGVVLNSSESISGIKVENYNIMDFIAGKANLITYMIEQNVPTTDIKQIEKLIPFIKQKDQDGNTAYTIPLEAKFHIPANKGGANAEFLSYFVYSYFDFKLFMEDTLEKYGQSMGAIINIPSISFKDYTMSNVASDIVLLNKSVQTDAFVFMDNRGNYYTGPMHLMPDGTYMKGKQHSSNPNYAPPPDKILTKKTVPNAKVIDNRQFVKASKANFNYSRISEFITNDDVVNSLAQNLGTESLLVKPKTMVSNFWCGLDISGKNRFAFTVNMSNLLAENTVFPGLLKTIQDTDEVEYQNLISSMEILDFSIIRKRVRKENRISPDLNIVTISPDDVPLKLVTTKDFRGKLSAKTQLTDKFGNSTVEKLKKICSIEEIYVKNAGGLTRTFSGTDIDISSKNDGKYQYEVNIEVKDPVPLYLRSKIAVLEGILNGSTGVQGWNNYLKLCTEPQYSDNILNRFNIEFLSAYNNFMGSEESNFIVSSILKYVNVLFLLNADEDSKTEATRSIKMLQYLTNISSPNTGNPAGVQTVATLIEDLIKKLNHLLDQMSHYKKIKSYGHTNEQAGTSLVGGHLNKTFKFSHVFEKIVELTGTSVDSPIGYDFLSINQDSIAANLAGLRVINRHTLRDRFDLETSKLFSGAANSEAAIEIKEASSTPNLNPVVYNPGDTISAKKFSYLAPSYVYLPRRETQNILQVGSISNATNLASMCDLMLDVIRFKKDRAEGLSTKDIFYSKSIDLPTKTQQRRMDLIKHFSTKGATFEEPGSEILKLNENGLPTVPDIGLQANGQVNGGVFNAQTSPQPLTLSVLKSEDTTFQALDPADKQEIVAEQAAFFNNFVFGGPDILTSAINPNPLLYSMAVLGDFKFIDKGLGDDEKVNSLLYYNLASSAGGKKIKLQVQAYALAKAFAAGFGNDSKLAKESPLTAAPNHVKSMILSVEQRDVVANSTLYKYIASGNDPFKNPLFYGYVNFNYKILNQIEVFRGFTRKNGETMVCQADWDLLRDFDLSEENFDDDTLLLCRQKRYANNTMGIPADTRTALSMPFFDEYFLVTSQEIQDTLNIKTDFAVLTANVNTSRTFQQNSPIKKSIFDNIKDTFSTNINSFGFGGTSDQTSQYRASESLRQKLDFKSSRGATFEPTRGAERKAIRTELTRTNIATDMTSYSPGGVRDSVNSRNAAKATRTYNKMSNAQLSELLDSLKLTQLSEVNNIRATVSQERTNGEVVTRNQNITDEELELLEELGDTKEYQLAIEKMKTSSNTIRTGTSSTRSSSGQSSGLGSAGSTSGGSGGGGGGGGGGYG